MTSFQKAAVLGATGPTGIHLVENLRDRVSRIRVVSRSLSRLEGAFPGEGIERFAADVLEEGPARRAVEGCDLVFDCIGLPSALMDRHPRVAENVARAVQATGARCLQVSSYWSYLPIQKLPLDESHPRENGPPWVHHRRRAEDVLQGAGAAVLHLPDFYGPAVHTSIVQNALRDAVRGKPMSWIGGADVEREQVFVPDAMRMVSDLAHCEEAYGERWILPGAGPLSGRRLAGLASAHLGRNVALRSAGPLLLRMVALFNAELRRLLPMVPHYARPISYDASKLASLLGPLPATPYERGIAETLDSLRSADRDGPSG